MKAYGDPRSPIVDPIDWVERIPFSEIRNYVQRVIEGMLVYRHRLGSSEREHPAQKRQLRPSRAQFSRHRRAHDRPLATDCAETTFSQ